MLEHRDDFSVVQSQADGHLPAQPVLVAHLRRRLLVSGIGLNPAAAFFDQTLDRWLKSCTPEQRRPSSTPYTSSSSQATPQAGRSSSGRRVASRTSRAYLRDGQKSRRTKPKRSSCTLSATSEALASAYGTRTFRAASSRECVPMGREDWGMIRDKPRTPVRLAPIPVAADAGTASRV